MLPPSSGQRKKQHFVSGEQIAPLLGQYVFTFKINRSYGSFSHFTIFNASIESMLNTQKLTQLSTRIAEPTANPGQMVSLYV
jgi:hypothetical protein